MKYPSRAMEAYFDGTMIGSKSAKGIEVPSIHFNKDRFQLPQSDDPKFEFWGRQGSIDCQVTHELLSLESNLVKSVAVLLDSLEPSERDADVHVAIAKKLQLFIHTNGLALQSNFRARTWALTSSCKAKLNIRDVILDKTKGDSVVSEALRGSCFLNKGIFGPIPQDTQGLVDAFPSREDSRLSFVASTQHRKRTSTSSHARGPARKRVNFRELYNPPHRHAGGSHDFQSPSSSTTVSSAPALFPQARPQGHRGKHRRGRTSRR